MSASKWFSATSTGLALALAAAVFTVDTGAFSIVSEAEAGSRNKVFHAQTKGLKGYRSMRHGYRRAGVVLGNNHHFNSRTTSSVELRRFQLEQRNRRVVIDNQLRAARRSANVLDSPARVVQRNAFINSGAGHYYDGGSDGVVVSGAPACPSGFNCGYRLYQGGSGPRLITPGIPAGNGLPAHDGVNGPAFYSPHK